jgi:hypothetical protein
VTGPWEDVRKEFESTRTRIRRQTTWIKEKATAKSYRTLTQTGILQELDLRFAGKLKVASEDATLPAHNLIWPKNPNFYGREDLLSEIRGVLDHDISKPEFKSWALWGMAGIGKSQTALAYAQKRMAEGLQAVFWVRSETSLDLARSFTEIALALNLQGAEETDDENRNLLIVLKWLQKTSK